MDGHTAWKVGLYFTLMVGYWATKCASTEILSSQKLISEKIGIDNNRDWLLIHIPGVAIYCTIGFLLWRRFPETNLMPLTSAGLCLMSIGLFTTSQADQIWQVVAFEVIRMAGSSIFQNVGQLCWINLVRGNAVATNVPTLVALLGGESGRLFVVFFPKFEQACAVTCGVAGLAALFLLAFRNVTRENLEIMSCDQSKRCKLKDECQESEQKQNENAQKNTGCDPIAHDPAEDEEEKEATPLLQPNEDCGNQSHFGPLAILAVIAWFLQLTGSKTWATLNFKYLETELGSKSFALYTALSTCFIGLPVNVVCCKLADTFVKRGGSLAIYLGHQATFTAGRVGCLVFVLVLQNSNSLRIILLCAFESLSTTSVNAYVLGKMGPQRGRFQILLTNCLVIGAQIASLVFVLWEKIFSSQIAMLAVAAGFPALALVLLIWITFLEFCVVGRRTVSGASN